MRSLYLCIATCPLLQAPTHIMGLEIFYNFVVWLKLGYATAIAWILGFLLIGFTVYQLRILRQVEFKADAGGEA